MIYNIGIYDIIGDIMKYEDIETFLQVTESGNIITAANYLHVTQSTVSSRLQLLEKELEISLFYRQRGKKETSLTPAGIQFLPIAQLWIALWNDANNIKKSQLKQNITIAAPETINISTLFPIHDEIITKHKEINLFVKSYHSKEIHRMIDSQLCDIGFCTNLYHYTNIITTPLYEEEMVIVSHLNHPYSKSHNLNDLSYGMEIYVDYSSDFNNWHQRVFNKIEHDIFSVGTSSMETAYLTKEDRWAILPKNTAQNFINTHKDFVINAFKKDIPKRNVYVLTYKYPKPGILDCIKKIMTILNTELSKNNSITMINNK